MYTNNPPSASRSISPMVMPLVLQVGDLEVSSSNLMHDKLFALSPSPMQNDQTMDICNIGVANQHFHIQNQVNIYIVSPEP
jgi:hypothetical protein